MDFKPKLSRSYLTYINCRINFENARAIFPGYATRMNLISESLKKIMRNVMMCHTLIQNVG